MDCIYLAPLHPKRCHNWCFSFTHSLTHSHTNGDWLPWQNQPACQEQLGVRCLAQGTLRDALLLPPDFLHLSRAAPYLGSDAIWNHLKALGDLRSSEGDMAPNQGVWAVQPWTSCWAGSHQRTLFALLDPISGQKKQGNWRKCIEKTVWPWMGLSILTK